MSTIVTRAGKGSPLTHNEVDANFNNLNNDKYQSGSSPSFAGTTLSTGNLTFSGTAQRITGDMSTATSNAVLFQTSTANGVTRVAAIPNGTSAQAQFTALNSSSDPTNASGIQIVATATEARVQAANFGTGTSLPMTFFTGGSERLRLDTSGNVGIGTASPTDKLQIEGTSTAPVVSVRSTTTGSVNQAALNLFRGDSTNGFAQFGVGTTSTNTWQFGLRSGSTSWQLFDVGANTARLLIDTSGNVGIGGTADASAKVNVLGTLPTSGTNTNVFWAAGTIPSGSTGDVAIFRSNPSTAAASFTAASLTHFWANQGTIGAGSAVTSQYAFLAPAGLTGATNNYGFYSNIASGSNRWNFYAAGTAQNYFAGNTFVGTTSASATADVGIKLISQEDASNPLVRNVVQDGSGAYNTYTLYSTNSGAYKFYVTTAGVINATTTTITGISDERLKENIRDLDAGLNEILSVKPRRFDWKAGKGQDKKNAVGFIAQEFEQVFPNSVSKSLAGADGIEYKTLCHEELIPAMVKAIQELSAKVAALEAK